MEMDQALKENLHLFMIILGGLSVLVVVVMFAFFYKIKKGVDKKNRDE